MPLFPPSCLLSDARSAEPKNTRSLHLGFCTWYADFLPLSYILSPLITFYFEIESY